MIPEALASASASAENFFKRARARALLFLVSASAGFLAALVKLVFNVINI
jgi:hypothetical protein